MTSIAFTRRISESEWNQATADWARSTAADSDGDRALADLLESLGVTGPDIGGTTAEAVRNDDSNRIETITIAAEDGAPVIRLYHDADRGVVVENLKVHAGNIHVPARRSMYTVDHIANEYLFD